MEFMEEEKKLEDPYNLPCFGDDFIVDDDRYGYNSDNERRRKKSKSKSKPISDLKRKAMIDLAEDDDVYDEDGMSRDNGAEGDPREQRGTKRPRSPSPPRAFIDGPRSSGSDSHYHQSSSYRPRKDVPLPMAPVNIIPKKRKADDLIDDEIEEGKSQKMRENEDFADLVGPSLVEESERLIVDHAAKEAEKQQRRNEINTSTANRADDVRSRYGSWSRAAPIMSDANSASSKTNQSLPLPNPFQNKKRERETEIVEAPDAKRHMKKAPSSEAPTKKITPSSSAILPPHNSEAVNAPKVQDVRVNVLCEPGTSSFRPPSE